MRVERTWALDAVAIADALRAQDPSWGSETFDLADGRVVLCGSGLYVNRALAVGLEESVTDEHFALLERQSRLVGVVPAIEVSDATMPAVRDRLAGRGYRPSGETAVLVRPLTGGSHVDVDVDVDPAIVIERVGESDLVSVWQQTSAMGWGHSEPDARRASDAFARAAARADDPGLVLARSARDGRPVGCASLAIRGGVATLGGMSTLPDERRHGVQKALILYRLQLARDRDCDIAATTTAIDGASERNLLRHGFRRLQAKTTFQLSPIASRGSTDLS